MPDRRTRTALLACVLPALVIAAPAARAQYAQYTVQTVRYPTDPTFTQLLGINDAGTIVGDHGATVNQGFRLSGGAFTPEQVPGATSTRAAGVSNAGFSVGSYVDAAGVTHGYVRDAPFLGGGFNTFDAPGTAFARLLGINPGAAVAAGYSSTDPAGVTDQRAFIGFDGGGLAYLTLPTNVNSEATGVNDARTLVGFYQPSATTSDGFLYGYLTGRATTLRFPGSTFTRALGVNDRGEVVGSYLDAMRVQHGFVDVDHTVELFGTCAACARRV